MEHNITEAHQSNTDDIQYVDLSEYGGVDNGDGTYTFMLGHKDSITIEEIPYGYKYEITEKDYSEMGYKTTIDGNFGKTINGTMDDNKSHEFVNKNHSVVPTEIRLTNLILPGLIGIALICIYYIIKIKKKLRAQVD